MSALRVFTQQPRVEIIRSNLNQSTSKQSWTFSRQKRFPTNTPYCPQICYEMKTTLSDIKTQFGKDQRRLFTEVSQVPTSWNYNPILKSGRNGKSIGKGREQVIANSYIDKEKVKNPGPGRYETKRQRAVSYSVRPKTAQHRNYFILDKEQIQVPGPGNYETNCLKVTGKNALSKFKNNISGMMGKDSRFKSNNNGIPPSWTYQNGTRYSWTHGAKMGQQERVAFTDKSANKSITPGPGKYRIPTQFGHYKPFKRSSNAHQRVKSAKFG